MKSAAEYVFSSTANVLGFTGGVPAVGVTAGYDSSKTMLASLFKQYTGPNPEDNYVSVLPSVMANLIEVAGVGSYFMPHVIQRSNDKYMIFLASNAAAAVSRTFALIDFDATNGTLAFQGLINYTGNTVTGNKTVTGLRAIETRHTTGTVSTSGSSTTITGSGTGFQTERISVGARIGFGTTDHLAVSTWYDITAISSDTSLTISSAVDLAASTPYVIEEIRILFSDRNATTTNGGLHIIKGLSRSAFTLAGTTVNDAVSTDNVRACYHLRDAATATTTLSCGVALDDPVDYTQHDVYMINATTATATKVYKFNTRAALTVSAGRSQNAFIFVTGDQVTTGTQGTINNGRIITVNHLTASGEKSIYFATTTRIYRANLSGIVSGSTSWISDQMTEVPPGSVTTHVLTNSLSNIDYSETIDRLIIPTGVSRFGVYVGEYDTTNTLPFERYFANFTNRVKLNTTPVGAPDALFPGAACTLWTISGYMFIVPSIVTTGLNWIRVFPFGADGLYASTTNQRIITQKIPTPNTQKFYRIYVDHQEYEGSYELGMPTEAYKVYYRTSGIDDNSGTWISVARNGDISGATPGTHIQFMLELDTLGEFCIPTKIYSICVTYEDNSQDQRYQPSLSKSSAANNRFAWRQVAAWGSNIPNLQIRLYNADTGFLVLDDTVTLSSSGTWEYSTDGTTWQAWSASADAVGNYIRYTATSLPNNITVRALLTQA